MGDQLLVDIGNTAIKWARRNHGGQLDDFGYHEHLGSLPPIVLDRLWGTAPRPEGLYFASVADPDLAEQLAAWTKLHWHLIPCRIETEAVGFGVVNSYRQVGQLGVDRWLALIAARFRYQGAYCVADLGTAATVDLVNARGEHLGGLILPGIDMSRRALLEYTRIPRVGEIAMPQLPFGRDTATAVALGSRYALAGVVRGAVAHLTGLGESPKVFLLGSEANAVSPFLECSTIEAPHLVLEGIGHYAGGG